MLYAFSLLQNNLSLISKRFRYFNITFSTFVIAYLLQGTDSRTTLDYAVYSSQYQLNSGYFEYGYNVLVHISNYMNLSYVEFRLLFSVLISIIFVIAVNRLTENPAIAINGYMIASLISDIVQIRQLAMVAFVIMGYSFFKKKGTKYFIIGELFIILSVQFHSLGWMFLFLSPLVYLGLDKQIKLLKAACVIFIVMIAAFKVLPESIMTSIISKIIGTISSRSDIGENVSNVYSNGAGIKVIIFGTLITIIATVIILYVPIETLQKNLNIQILLPCIYVMMISILLTTVSIDYVRLLRAGTVLFIVLLSNLVSQGKVMKYYSLLILISLLSVYLQNGIVYQTNGQLIPYLLHFVNQNILP